VNVEATPLDADAFTRQTRTVRERCGAQPACCERCLVVCEIDGDELVCPECRRRWLFDDMNPCPRPATCIVRDEDGASDALCAVHSVLWRRLITRTREPSSVATNRSA
jgi:hypothetical protein